ncbi:MAG: phage integrase N-terminal SAM-like domain-containing protein [Clostridiales bacterium]|nr:phage integrase N-terminal SAM-like domain-containing protein [Clostridiales bacterium]
MQERIVTEELIEQFMNSMKEKNYKEATQKHYYRDTMDFCSFMAGGTVDQESCRGYQENLEKKYKVSSVNVILNGLNTFFEYTGWLDLKYKLVKRSTEKERSSEQLTINEYRRLLDEAERKDDRRLFLLMQSLCLLQLRVSEHQLITLEALKQGYLVVVRKDSRRIVFIPEYLNKKLLAYCKDLEIMSGPIFVTNGGKLYSRSAIHKNMKQLCEGAGVPEKKVSPQQLLKFSAMEQVLQCDKGNGD